MDWKDKTPAVFYSPSRHLCVSLSALIPIGHIVNLPQIHWLKTTITIYLLAHDDVIGQGISRSGSSLLISGPAGLDLEYVDGFTPCVAPQLRCPEQQGASGTSLSSRASLCGSSGLQER